jgi:hypothetical protein
MCEQEFQSKIPYTLLDQQDIKIENDPEDGLVLPMSEENKTVRRKDIDDF